MYEEVAKQIEDGILANHHRLGDQLPSERALIARFNVSRAVIRESLKVLVEKSLVEIRPGKGAFIRAPESSVVTNALLLYLRRQGHGQFAAHMTQVRRLLEVEIAGLAAANATAADLKDIAGALAAMEADKSDLERFTRADLLFHKALAAATGNPLVGLLLDPIAGLLLELMMELSPLAKAREQAIHHHREILTWVSKGDVGRARKAMAAHLAQFERRLIDFSCAAARESLRLEQDSLVDGAEMPLKKRWGTRRSRQG
jgi:GntR family transcriptional regulator, transcriptional repressor for pyruvate dehydrogenase complex